MIAEEQKMSKNRQRERPTHCAIQAYPNDMTTAEKSRISGSLCPGYNFNILNRNPQKNKKAMTR